VSPVLPLGTRRKGGGVGGEDDRLLNGAARVAAVEGGLGGCLDPTTIGPYGGSRVEQEEKTTRRNTEHGGNQPAC
jgi:hypothetical protein